MASGPLPFLGEPYDAPIAVPPGFTGYNAPTAPAAVDPAKVLTPLGRKWGDDLASIVTAPRDAYTGELQVWDPMTGHTTQAARDAAGGLAGLAMTGSLPFPAPAAALRTFGGRSAATADTAALRTAEVARDLGLSPGATYRETGWFHGADGQPRFEIPDDAARMTGVPFKVENERFGTYASRPLGEVLDHRALYDAYPDLARTRVNHSPEFTGNASYQVGVGAEPGTISLDASGPNALSLLLHEAQHGVQQREGFARGGSTTEFSGGGPFERSFDPVAYGQYRRLAGEVEARNVQARAALTPAQRRASLPWETQDVPDARQIVRFPDGNAPFGRR